MKINKDGGYKVTF